MLVFFANGTIKKVLYCRDGVRNDSPAGTPAYVEFYPDGKVRFVVNVRGGLKMDKEDGTPALVCYSEEGDIIAGFSSVNGDLNAEAIHKMNKAAQVFRVAALLKKADQSVVPSGMPLSKEHLSAAAK